MLPNSRFTSINSLKTSWIRSRSPSLSACSKQCSRPRPSAMSFHCGIKASIRALKLLVEPFAHRRSTSEASTRGLTFEAGSFEAVLRRIWIRLSEEPDCRWRRDRVGHLHGS